MRLVFDRGTIILAEAPQGLDLERIPGVLWDERVARHRAPARLCYRWCPSCAAGVSRSRTRPGRRSRHRPNSVRSSSGRTRRPPSRPGARPGVAAMVVLPTGSGKTRLALGAIAATRTPALCLAPTRALCDQWAAALGAVWDGPIGRFGDGERVVGPVTIATFAGAYRHMAALGDKFGLLIVDEAHHFGAGGATRRSRCRSRRCASA